MDFKLRQMGGCIINSVPSDVDPSVLGAAESVY